MAKYVCYNKVSFSQGTFPYNYFTGVKNDYTLLERLIYNDIIMILVV